MVAVVGCVAVLAWSASMAAAATTERTPERNAAAGSQNAHVSQAPGAPGPTATPKTAERMLEHPVTLSPEACPPPFDLTVRCGTATAPANWAKPDGRNLEIWYALVPAPNGMSTGVTVPFMGGPGESISEVAELFLALVPALPDRDMLIVDVRGNGRSGRLGCPTFDSASFIPAGRDQVEAVAACAREVGPRRDDYTTVGSVLDVEAIRRALQLPKPSLLGVSYGTWVVQTYAALFPDVVQAAVIDGIVPFDLDPWGRTYTDAMPRVLRLRCERTLMCDPDEADAHVRHLASVLAAQPVPMPDGGRRLTEGVFSHMSIFAIQFDLSDYLAAVDSALGGDYGPLIALTEAKTALPPAGPISGGRGLIAAVSCSEYSAPFDLDHTFATRLAEFEGGLAGLPDDAFGWFSKQGWVGSGWEQVDFCLNYPKPLVPSRLRPPYDGPFPNVPVLMLNGDIDLQAPLESAERARANWPNSVFLTIEDAPHVSIQTSQCALITMLSFLADPVLPDEAACEGQP